ncbi:MAG: succinate--CoA ligase subunit beta, partial [Firmicutes bacterium]|nr:succinate--CoA ligase subunit beta [Bacillota bacterium]
RQQDLVADAMNEAEHPLERRAKEMGLAYVKLDGDVGIIGNGAGLVMTTLDMIQRSGGRPANFLDIGGGAKAEVVRNALRIVLSDPDVKSILLNVFGGITRGDEVAKGLLAAFSEVDVKVPVVVRLAGTRAKEGLELLAGTRLVTAETFLEAAQKAVALAREGQVQVGEGLA